jgi:periplasmic protein CpxP/Spy
MKKLILIALALVTIEGIAQQRMGRPDRKDIAQNMEKFTPEETAGLQTKRMTLQLDLNEFQQKEIYKLNLENATKREAKIASLKAKRESGKMEAPTKADRLKMMNERLDNEINTKIKMNYILSTEQRTKLEQIEKEMKHRLEDGMRGKKRLAQNNTPNRNRRF